MDKHSTIVGAAAAAAMFLAVSSARPAKSREVDAEALMTPASRIARRTSPYLFLVAPLTATISGLALGSPLLTIVGTLLLLIIPRMVRSQAAERRGRAAAATVPDFVDLVAHRCRSGATISGAFRETAGQFPELDSSLQPVLRDIALGTRLEQALVTAPPRTLPGDLRLFFTTCAVLLATGGPAAESLERLADRMRVAASASAEAQAQSGQQLASASLMALLPIGFAGLVAFTDPQARELYMHRTFGALCLGGSIGLSGLGWIWMQRILGSDGG